MKIANSQHTNQIRLAFAWLLLVAAISFQTSVKAADDNKEPVKEDVKEQMIEDAKKKENKSKAEMGEASYNVQDCETDDKDKDADSKNVEDNKDENAESDSESSESTDELDDCKKQVK